MALKAKTPGEWLLLLTAIIVVGGFTFWCADLTSDPPMYFSGIGQSLSTDPYMYDFHARNKILYGDSNPLNDPRWVVFEKSLVSLCSYFWLSITDISIKEANTVGVLLSVAGLFLILLGLPKYHHPWVTCAVALCYLANVSLLTYGRLPYLENGLIFWSGLVFLIWSRWGEKTWGVAAAGAVVALATVTGKVFGILLLPALILSILVSERQTRWQHIMSTAGAFVGMTVFLVLILFNGHISQAFGFVSYQSLGLHGFPDGLKSPWAFAEHLVSFGQSSHLFSLNPDLLLFLLAGGLILTSRKTRTSLGLEKLPPTTIFSMSWLLCGWIGLMPLNYSPLRYSLFLIPAAIVLCYSTIDHLIRTRKEAVVKTGRLGLSVAAVLFWILTYHFIMNAFFYNNPDSPQRLILWSSLPAGIALAVSYRFLMERKLRLYSRPLLITVAVGLLCSSVLVNSFRIRRKHFLDHNFTVAEANLDLARILGGNTVITGPYAPAVTFQTNHQSLIHFFGAADEDSSLFEKYPITHIAVDVSNLRKAVEGYPALASLKPVASYWIRDTEVEIFNVSKVFSNSQASAYIESPYELAAGYFQMGHYDSALATLNTAPGLITSSKAAGLLYSRLMYQRKQYEHVLNTLLALIDRYPTDFSLQLECGHLLQKLALMRQDRALMIRSQQYYEKATILNPYKASYANRLFGRTLQQWNGQSEQFR